MRLNFWSKASAPLRSDATPATEPRKRNVLVKRRGPPPVPAPGNVLPPDPPVSSEPKLKTLKALFGLRPRPAPRKPEGKHNKVLVKRDAPPRPAGPPPAPPVSRPRMAPFVPPGRHNRVLTKRGVPLATLLPPHLAPVGVAAKAPVMPEVEIPLDPIMPRLNRPLGEEVQVWLPRLFPDSHHDPETARFIARLISRSMAPAGVVYQALALLKRLPKESLEASAAEAGVKDIFLGAFLVAAKTTLGSPKNKLLVPHAGLNLGSDTLDLAKMKECEVRFLKLCRYNVHVHADELEEVLPPLIERAVLDHFLTLPEGCVGRLTCLDGVERRLVRRGDTVDLVERIHQDLNTLQDFHTWRVAQRTSTGWRLRYLAIF
jgi:hypothetical protein